MKKVYLFLTSLILLTVGSPLFARPFVRLHIPLVKPVIIKTVAEPVPTPPAVEVVEDELDIDGTLTVPEGEGPFPVVIIDSRSEGEKDFSKAIDSLVSDLAKNGIASYTFDASKVDLFDSSVINSIEDYLSDLEEIDGSKIGLLGWDVGVINVLQAANSNKHFDSIATWSAPQASKDSTKSNVVVSYTKKGTSWRKGETVTKKVVYTSAPDLSEKLDNISEIRIPIASFHGENDEISPVSISEQIQDLGSNKKNKLVLFEDADHTFNFFSKDLSTFEDLKAETVDWFIETLK